MKNKRIIVILVSAVIIVWGMIFYKFFYSIPRGDDTIVSVPIKRENNQEIVKTKLLLNYPDPFSKMRVQTKRMNNKKKPHPEIQTIDELVYLDFEYAGTIEYNRDIKALIKRGGKNMICIEGDSISKFIIISISKDSIIVRGKNMHTIRK